MSVLLRIFRQGRWRACLLDHGIAAGLRQAGIDHFDDHIDFSMLSAALRRAEFM
jgi:hypothetical protein